jgi:hypothetical protein
VFGDMEHGRSSVEKYEKFTWEILNFSRFQIGQEIYSEPFVLGGYPWYYIITVLEFLGECVVRWFVSILLFSCYCKGLA